MSDDDNALRERCREKLRSIRECGSIREVSGSGRPWVGVFDFLLDQPWAVIHVDRAQASVRVHFVERVTVQRVQQTLRILLRDIPSSVDVKVSRREVCAEHSDCFEAGAEMRRACFAYGIKRPPRAGNPRKSSKIV